MGDRSGRMGREAEVDHFDSMFIGRRIWLRERAAGSARSDLGNGE